MNAIKDSQGMFLTLSQTSNAKLTQENTSEVSSRRGKRKAKQAAKKNGNANKNTNASLSAQQLTVNIEVSSDGKTRIVRGGMEYKSGNGWSKFATVLLSFPLSGQIIDY